MEEIWKNIKDYEGLYQISNFGKVKSVERISSKGNHPSYRKIKESILKPSADKAGYLRVPLSKNGKRKSTSIQRLVIIHFLGGFTKERNCSNHKDGDKSNNHYSNLEIVNHSENNRHSYRVLNHPRPKGQLKISKQDVNDVFSLRQKGISMPKIGARIGISATHVHRILNKKSGLYL